MLDILSVMIQFFSVKWGIFLVYDATINHVYKGDDMLTRGENRERGENL